MPYMQKERMTEDRVVIVRDKYYSWKLRPRDKSIREQRAARKNETPEQQKANNQRRLQEAAALKIMNNFSGGDFYLSCSYDNEHLPDKSEKESRARKDLNNFIAKLKRRYKKLGCELKYVAVNENASPGSKGRVHAHLLIPQIDLPGVKNRKQFFSDLWGKGRVHVDDFGGELEDCIRLAGYFRKESKVKAGARIRMSHNLKNPIEKKKEIKHTECYSLDIQVPAGYEIEPALTYQGYTADGYPCQHIVMQRTDSKEASARRRWSMKNMNYKQSVYKNVDKSTKRGSP